MEVSVNLSQEEAEILKDSLSYYCAWCMERYEDTSGIDKAVSIRAKIHIAQTEIPIAT